MAKPSYRRVESETDKFDALFSDDGATSSLLTGRTARIGMSSGGTGYHALSREIWR